MKIKYLEIENFRGIKKIIFENLKDVVVIAGPNGSGKSTIFDAIRLLKSVYGGYNNNEMDLWFNEFQINLAHKNEELKSLFRNSSKSITIKADITLTTNEKEYIRNNASLLLKQRVVSQFFPELNRFDSIESIATTQRTKKKSIQITLKEEIEKLLTTLSDTSYSAKITITPDLTLSTFPNPVIEVVFSNFVPNSIGIIDYHGPNRTYNRERLGGITLDNNSVVEKMSQHALYNYAGKYSNIKSEMASSYLKDLVRKASGLNVNDNTIIKTLVELFGSFFPEKKFLGPVPNANGDLDFPVKLNTGEIHDIDDLSTGEKEIIYGYLRLRNNVPHNSVLLLDEPELHLNPRLVKGLPDFYRKNLGEAMGNQIWLVTHSDTFLRETVGQINYSTYHLKFADTTNSNQIKKVDINENFENAVIDLVGDLATYHPGEKVVLIEGGGDTEFDLGMISTLFPEFIGKVNAISGGNKKRVIDLHSMLKKVEDRSKLPMRFYAIVDWDTDDSIIADSTSVFKWDVYSIENYLLEEKYILQAIQELTLKDPTWTIQKVKSELAKCAKESLNNMVRHKLLSKVERSIKDSLNFGVSPTLSSFSKELHKSLQVTEKRVSKSFASLSENNLSKIEKQLINEYQDSLKTKEWKKTFRGKAILSLFAGKHIKGTKYEVFINVIINRMKSENFKPIGMKKIIDSISAN